MRKILGIVFLLSATVLIAHGLFSEAEAERRMPEVAATTDVNTFRRVAMEFPYCQATINARLTHLKAAEGTLAYTRFIDSREFARTVLSTHKTLLNGASAKPPYLTPEAAAIVGLLAMFLAILLPGTLFRFLAFFVFLGSVFAALAASFPPETQVVLCRDIAYSNLVIAWMPRIAQGLIALAGLLIVFEKGSKPAAA